MGYQRDLNELKLVGLTAKSVSYDAKLGPFTFKRSHSYYWIAKGPMPIEVAREMYRHPDGRHAVRVDGHCGEPSPDDYGHTWLMPDGRQVTPKTFNGEDQEVKWNEMYEKGLLSTDGKNLVFSDDPASLGAKCFIAQYHIDTALGLKLYVDKIREHGLDKLPEPVGWENLL